MRLLRSRLLAGLSLAALLSACGGGGSNDSLLQPTQTPQPQPQPTAVGTLRMSMTDAPACGFDQVFVTVDKVRIHQSATAGENDSGWTDLVLSPARRIDLLTLNNGVMTELGQMPLSVGHYSQLRLVLATNPASGQPANSVVQGGIETALATPSGAQSGIKLDASIDIAANQMADFVLDFDACKSVVSAGASGKFQLKPSIKLLPLLISGASGHVDLTLANGLTSISLQAPDGTVVTQTAPDATGRFVLALTPPGTYNLVITAPGRATGVVTGVVVSAGAVTQVGGTGNLTLSASGSGTLAGTVSTGATPVDADVRVMQTLTGGAKIELVNRRVDSSSGAYSYLVPVGAPMVASASGAGAISAFIADHDAAGYFNLAAISGSSTKAAGPLQLSAMSTVTTNFSFP
jgi:hypothetical protein